MKMRMIFTLVISALMLFACTAVPKEPTPTSVPVTPTKTYRPLIMWTSTATSTPTIAASPTQGTRTPTQTFTPTPFSAALPADEEPIIPGIYPVFFREGSIYINLPSGNTQELLHLYDKSADISPSGDTTFLWNSSRDTIPSPDGKIITYMSMEDGFIYNYDWQLKTTQKIPQPDSDLYSTDWIGNWSPDGKYLLYAKEQETQHIAMSIYIANIPQNTISRMTNWEWIESNPVWSPDFQRIAFDSDITKVGLPDGSFVGSTDIFVMSAVCITNLDTCVSSSKKQLTDTGTQGDASHPLWNPKNSSELAFIYFNGETSDEEIYLVDLDGNIINLTNTPNDSEEVFSWSPDGEKLVLRRYNRETGGDDLYILNISDGSTTKITDSPKMSEGIPFWSSDGENIAFEENTNDSASGITIFSVKKNQSQTLTNSTNSNFLFWLTVFPEISKGTTLTVSPAGQGLHLRSGASIDSSITGKLQSGDKITIMGESSGNGRYSWWKIKSDQGEGWVLQNYNWYLPNASSTP